MALIRRKVSLGEEETGAQTATLTVENNNPFSVTYDLSHATALSTGGVITPSFFLSDAGASFSTNPLTMDPGNTEVWTSPVITIARP